MELKKLVVIFVFLFAVFWSLEVFRYMENSNQTRNFKGNEEIMKYCGEKEGQTEYCLGFKEGYNWAVQQVEIDKNLQMINFKN